MAHLSQHNRMRLAAGLAIDPSYEISEHNKPKATSDLDHDAVQALIAEAMAADPRSAEEIKLEDDILSVLSEGTGACQACQDIQHEDSDFQAGWKLHSQAKMLGRKNPEMARSQAAAAAMHMEKFNAKKAELKCEDCKNGVVTDPAPAADPQMQESVVTEAAGCKDCAAKRERDGDYQASWKLKAEANNLRRAQPKLAQGQDNAAASHLAKFNAKKDDIKCDKCKGGAETIKEFVVGANTPTSWEKDEKQPVNVVSDDDTFGDKDESPEQLKALDTPSKQDQSGGGNLDRKITVPTRIKKLLRDEIKEAEAESKRMNYSNRDASYFYDDLASMFKDLLMHLDGGTVDDIKRAQIFMTSLMGPMLHKIPADVVNYLARGGEPASLRSYMTKVDTTLINPNKLSS